mgnify:CR=1 FL=1
MYKNILVPTDGSKLSAKAADEAVKLAKAFGAKITFLNVMPDYRKVLSETFAVPSGLSAPVQKKYQAEAEAFSKKVIDRACTDAAAAGIACNGVSIVHESAYEAIIKQAGKSKSDVIVMASHGRKGLQGFLLGSETTKVLVHSKIPVLVVR